MTLEEALSFLDTLLAPDHLSDVQELVFRKSWEGWTYSDMGKSAVYNTEYIKQVGCELWQLLSKVFAQRVTKSNFQSVIRRYQQEQLISTEVSKPQTSATIPPTSAEAPKQPIPASTPLRPYQNLPPRNYTALIDRTAELTQLMQFLSFDHPTHCISVEGIGGAGKTTLVLEAAYRCLQASQGEETAAPKFDAIIFTSAKQQHLTPHGILPRLKRERTLRDIFRVIARTLQCPEILSSDFDEQLEQIQERLARESTLLIVDNLETLEEQEIILSFLYELPSTVKTLITSREQAPFAAIRLESLPQIDGIQLIQYQAKEKGIFLSWEESQILYERTGGIPAAIVYAIGQLTAGYLFKQVVPRLTLATGDFCRFYFETSVHLIKEQSSHQLLMALAMFPKFAFADAVIYVAAIADPDTAAEGLARLQQLSLIRQHQERYDMLPLTRGYALAELATHSEFEQEARNRWISWYLQFAQTHGDKDCKEWNEYSDLETEWENLTEVIEWCIAQDRYADVRQFWQAVKCYTYAQGRESDRLTDWNAPLEWTDWLIQSAEYRQDWSTAIEAMFDRGKKLILMGQPKHLESADVLFTKAWSLRHHQTADFQVDLATQIALLRIQQLEFTDATNWLQLAKDLLKRVQKPQQEATRSLIQLLYYQGEIDYKTGNYAQAKVLFQQALEQAQTISWQRAIFLAKDWLADIALQQGKLDEAQPLYAEGLWMAEQNQDKCRAAYTKRSLARLEQARGDFSAAYRFAAEAKAGFESLGMLPEAEETQTLLQTLTMIH